MGVLCLLFGTWACQRDWRLAIERPFGAEAPAVVALVGPSGEPLSPVQVIKAGAALDWDLDVEPPATLWALAYPNGTPLAERGVRLGGEEEPLPSPLAYRLELVDLGSQDNLQFVASEAPSLDLHYAAPPLGARDCTAVVAEPAVWPEILTRVEVASDGRLYAGLGRDPPALALIQNEAPAEVFRFEPGVTGVIRGIVDDGQRLWVVSRSGAFAALDRDHRVLHRGQLALTEVIETYGNRRGEVLVIGPTTEAPRQLTLTSSAGLRRGDFPPNVRALTVLDDGQTYVLDHLGIQRRAGLGWVRELDLPEAELTAVVGDDRGVFATARYRGLLYRAPEVGRWSELARPFVGFPQAMAIFPGGALFIVGRRDVAAIYDRSEFCLVRPAIADDLFDVAISPDGREAWAVGPTDDGAAGRWVHFRVNSAL